MVRFQNFISRPQPAEQDAVLPDIEFDSLGAHFASLIDYSGDCMADLVMMANRNGTKIIEFYQALQNGNLSQSTILKFDSTLQSFSFTDANFDGAIDLVLLFQNETGLPYLEVHHNKFPSKASSLCLANTEFPFDMGDLVDGHIKKIQRYQLDGRLNPSVIPVIRFGDLDSDGYP